jgi:hypothetical protein
MRTDPLGLALLAIARNAIEKQFGRSARTVIRTRRWQIRRQPSSR